MQSGRDLLPDRRARSAFSPAPVHALERHIGLFDRDQHIADAKRVGPDLAGGEAADELHKARLEAVVELQVGPPFRCGESDDKSPLFGGHWLGRTFQRCDHWRKRRPLRAVGHEEEPASSIRPVQIAPKPSSIFS